MLPANFLFKFFRNDSNSKDMNVNGASTAVTFKWGGYADKCYLTRVNFFGLEPTIVPSDFIGLTALTNGLLVKAYDANDNAIIDFLDGETIKSNGHFGWLAGTDSPVADAGGGAPDRIGIRWTLERAGRKFHLPSGGYVGITVQDNLTAINEFSAMGQGFIDRG